jgi:hypothetical protein
MLVLAGLVQAPLLAALHGDKPVVSSPASPSSRNPAMLRMQMSSWTAQRMDGDEHDWDEDVAEESLPAVTRCATAFLRPFITAGVKLF